MSRTVLAIYLEPAPYIVGLIENLRAVWDGRVDVAYAAVGLSQPWTHRPGVGESVLPPQVPAAIVHLRRSLAGGDYGLLHLAGWGHPVLLGALLLAKWYGIPVAMESDTPRPPQAPGWKAAVKRVMYPRLLSLPKVFLPGGSRQAQYLRDYGVGEERIRIARMTVDVERIQRYLTRRETEIRRRFRERLGIQPGAVVVLYLGRLEPHKGVLDLLEAFKTAEAPGAVLAVAGDGSLRDSVARAAGEDGRVRVLGRLAGDAVWDAYCGSDMLVVPSRFEPWGLVVNEAMAAGLPVIATERVGCVDDLVRAAPSNGEGEEGCGSGVIVPAESPASLSCAIMQLVRDADLRKRLGAGGRMLISSWTLRDQAERTAAAWRTICE